MALVLLGGGIVDLRGSVAGNTFSRSRFGVTVRCKTSPLQPQTTFNTVQRASMVGLSRAWSQTLTDTERAGWNAFALLNPETNRYGQTAYLTGHQWYVRLNYCILSSGGTALTSPPVSASYPSGTAISYTANHAGAGTLTWQWTDPGFTGTPVLRMFMSNNQSAGVEFTTSRLRYIGTVSAAAGGPGPVSFNFITLWKNRFRQNPLLVSRVIGSLGVFADADTGAQSAAVYQRMFVS